MSYDFKINRLCDHRVFDERQITEGNNVTVITKNEIANENVIVKINGFKVDKNYKSEAALVEDVTTQFSGTTNSFVVSQPPIYDGLSLRRLITSTEQIIVQMEVIDEDDSSQFTGTENFLITQHIPLLTELNFSSSINSFDVNVKINGISVDVIDVDSKTGRITLDQRPSSTDVVTVSYFFRAKVKSVNASGLISIEEYPASGQQVKVRYFGLVEDGWSLVNSEETNRKDIVFDREKKTNRGQIVLEDVTTQFAGSEKSFFTEFKPLMPYKADLRTQPSETLANSVYVEVNGVRVLPTTIDAITGEVFLSRAPNATDIVKTSYWYLKEDINPDIISIDYQVEENQCPKCNRIGMVDDFEYDETGNLIIVENEEKLAQDLRKIVITIKGSNTEHLWYGTNLDSLIGNAYLPDFIEMQLSAEIQNAVRDLKSLQVQQENYQEVTDREFVNYIDNLEIERSSVDPMTWSINADIITQQGTVSQLVEELQFDSPFFDQENTNLLSTLR